MPSEFVTAPREGADPAQVIHDRITVVEMVYHRPSFGGEAFLSDSRFNRELQTYEQVYERRHVTVTQEWQKLDFGWIKAIGMLVILNEEGQHLRVYSTEEERNSLKKRVLEISFGPPDSKTAWLVYPGETMRAVPNSSDDLFIRCPSGKARCTMRAFPA